MTNKLRLREVVAMGVGGLIGGGIFAALGVAANLAGNSAFLAYLFAGLVALASGYSYVKMTSHFKEDGGSFTFLEHYVSNKNIAGMVGWILIVGYIGTMAMYSYAFGSFAAGLLGFSPHSIARSLISLGIIAVFVLVNFIGVKESGESEDILVYIKVVILLLFAAAGTGTVFLRPEYSFFMQGLFNRGLDSVVIAAAAIFVSFEGFQLLTYEYSEIEGGPETLKKGVFYSIILTSLIYILVAIVTTSLLTPAEILAHKETALAFAAGKLFDSALINNISYALVSIAALFSTASAINATLFGTARLSYKIASEKELPEVFSFRNKKGIPTKSLLIIGLLTALFASFGTLEEITAFASVAFIIVFGVVNYVCLREKDLNRKKWVPSLGLLGTLSAIPLLIWHLYTRQPHVLAYIIAIFAILLFLEFVYFERESIENAATEIEHEVEKDVEELEREL